MTNKRLYTHFELNRDLIPFQKQVTNDIYKILTSLGYSAQTPDNVAISTIDGVHIIYAYPFETKGAWKGVWKYAIALKVGVDYNFEDLQNIVEKKVKETVYDNRTRETVL